MQMLEMSPMPDTPAPDPSASHRCPYCGKQIVGDGMCCARCVSQGFNHLHEVTGRSNGWDRPKPHYRVVGRKAS